MTPAPSLVRSATAIAAALLLISCAGMSAFSPDLDAKAPRLQGYGQSDIAITTRSANARRLFNEGVLQAYAFNEAEAVRTFKAALAQDPHCAMCAWGVAWQLGPNINDSDRDGTAEALKYVDLALRVIDGATARERALVESLALRYAHASAARETAPLMAEVCGRSKEETKAHPLDVVYAERMRQLADAYPSDPDILSLYAEAEIIATEGDYYWDKDGKPAGRIGEVTARLEKLLPSHISHTGLNHYLIHVADGVIASPRAVAAADRLGTLAPRSPHLVHMPAHTYASVGRYPDAMRVNVEAVAHDAALADELKAQGFSVSKDWRRHNLHFLWYAAIMSGQLDAALDAADRWAQRAATSKSAFGEYVRSLRLITLVRMEQWERVLQEPLPAGDNGLAQMWYEQSRGMAQARLSRLDEAQASLARMQEAAAKVRTAHASSSRFHRDIRSMTEVAEAQLQAMLSLRQRRFDEAVEHQSRAMKAATKIDATEPPLLADGTRLGLGEVQLSFGRWREAEATFREALAEHPASGWALRGLARALQEQNRAADAAAVQRELDRSWAGASASRRVPA